MPVAILVLLLVVALGRGGYAPWGGLVLEVGTALLLLWTFRQIVRETSPEARARHIEARRARRGLPFLARHPGLARLASFGRYSAAEVEVLPPGVADRVSDRRPMKESWLFLGYPLQRTGLEAPLAAATVWIALSLVPLPQTWLARLSPLSSDLRGEMAALAETTSTQTAPWSLTPFLTLRNLWLWLAFVGLFYVSAHLAERPGKGEKLARLLLLLGVAYGAFGILQGLSARHESWWADPAHSGLSVTGTFDNRNHYALFLEMLLLSGLGWVGWRWASLSALARRPQAEEGRARLLLYGLGLVILSLGLVLSLSRSGIVFSLLGGVAFALLAKRSEDRRGKSSPALGICLTLAVAVIAFAAWIGFEPTVRRFELLPGDWQAEVGRWQVWTDSAGAMKDFWLTGSGLGSFRYVFPLYRSFGGLTFYSWAHNDYLQLLVELGIPGLALLAWLMASVAGAARRARERIAGSSPLTYLHSGFCAALIAIGLHSLTDFGLHMPANAALLGVTLGLVVGLRVGEFSSR